MLSAKGSKTEQKVPNRIQSREESHKGNTATTAGIGNAHTNPGSDQYIVRHTMDSAS